jgi:hypothetical protein
MRQIGSVANMVRDTFFDRLIESTVILPVLWDVDHVYQRTHASGLLLSLDLTLRRGSYRRVGFVKIRKNGAHGKVLPQQDLVDFATRLSETMRGEYFVDRYDGGSCQINLVRIACQ